MKGEKITMNAFDNSEFEAQREKYAAEAKKKMGRNRRLQGIRRKNHTEEQQNVAFSGMENLMSEFAECKNSDASPNSEKAQALVKKWQDFITENFYTCTKEILSGLGEMYAVDERFAANIDKHGDGTAEFMRDAIRVYCG